MNFQPPQPPARFSVSRVWPCSSCGYLAKSNISSAACPICGHIGLERSNVDSASSLGGLQTDVQGIGPDSVLSDTVLQEAKTSVAPSPDPSTLFMPMPEESSDVLMRIRNNLAADLTSIFGEFPVGNSFISNFYANLPIGWIVWGCYCRISYQGSSSCYRG
jgi:hypothetical protein